jgi:mannose-6-phosphate isomerase
LDPITLPSNHPADRFYRGGGRISELRGEAGHGSHTPEDWIASTTSVRGHAGLGQTVLRDGRPLAAAIEEDPLGWLGAEHVAAFGTDTRLLVKLLDAGQRLPVHAHPDAEFAHRLLGAAHGKAEAWYILSGGEIFLGLTRQVARDELAAMVLEQDVERMLGLMHRVEVRPHDTVFVPPGVLHAIGEGILLAEVQEPEDLSILLEWRDFELDGLADGHLGLGFEVAMAAVETRARSEAEIAALIRRTGGTGDTGGTVADALVTASAEFFRLERVEVRSDARLEPGLAVLIVVDGELELRPENGSPSRIATGATTVLPHGAGAVVLSGTGTVLVARPPLPR